METADPTTYGAQVYEERNTFFTITSQKRVHMTTGYTFLNWEDIAP